MRVFVVLCLVAAAYAEGGYNYQPVQSVSQGGSQQTYSAPSIASAPVEYSKEFYSYSAPDHEFEDHSAQQHINNAVRKNLQVVFIRGPETRGIENAALRLAQQSTESKTAIYVLQKQADVGSFAQQLQSQPSSIQSPPEVHFVKYRTQQDAQNAQQAIQSQYDQLPGSSQSHHGGQAPVLNYASQSQSISAPSPQAPSTAYLPSSVLKFFRK